MIHLQIQILQKRTQARSAADSLEDIPVELFLPVTQELANHLPTQAFPLEQEVCHTHRSVWNKVSLYQILDAFFWFPTDRKEWRRRDQKKREARSEWVRTHSKSLIIPLQSDPWPNVCHMRDRI